MNIDIDRVHSVLLNHNNKRGAGFSFTCLIQALFSTEVVDNETFIIVCDRLIVADCLIQDICNIADEVGVPIIRRLNARTIVNADTESKIMFIVAGTNIKGLRYCNYWVDNSVQSDKQYQYKYWFDDLEFGVKKEVQWQ